jgi:hypothetical protein
MDRSPEKIHQPFCYLYIEKQAETTAHNPMLPQYLESACVQFCPSLDQSYAQHCSQRDATHEHALRQRSSRFAIVHCSSVASDLNPCFPSSDSVTLLLWRRDRRSLPRVDFAVLYHCKLLSSEYLNFESVSIAVLLTSFTCNTTVAENSPASGHSLNDPTPWRVKAFDEYRYNLNIRKHPCYLRTMFRALSTQR